MINIIVTMAGNGRRFRDAGYSCPKYEIVAHGQTLFEWSMQSLANFWRAGARAVFVAQQDHHARPFLARKAEHCGIEEYKLIELPGLTAGQAASAIAAAPGISDKSAPIVIFNIDTYVSPDGLLPQAIRGEGWIPCFSGEGNGWSFAKVDEQDRVIEMREKVRISDWATIGLYHFASFELFEQLYRSHFSSEEGMEKGEQYIAPMYNTLIALNKGVYIQRLKREMVIPLGTPQELDAFKLQKPAGDV